jgi:protein O-GlcNAc transferase
MSGSLLRALGVPELIAESLEHYEQLAVDMARAPERLAGIRALLTHNARECPVFNTDRFRRHLEAAFTAVMERRRRGEPPASVRIPAIGSG